VNTGRRVLSQDGVTRQYEYVVGTGTLEPTDTSLRLVLTDAAYGQYSDAQIDDYRGLARRRFPWRPPLRLTVTARFSHPASVFRGTAGFGFWNDPFFMTGARRPTLPRAVWFFYASPSTNLKLDRDVPGNGWKAAVIDALSPGALAWAPVAPLAIPLMNIHPLYRRLWPPIQRALRIREAEIKTDMTEWHSYRLDWRLTETSFSLDGAPILECVPSPRGPLGFVAWVDNQYAIVTPWGQLGWGLLNVPGRQSMEIKDMAIAPP